MRKIETIVIHSESKSAWNVVGTQLGGKYKIARVPYLISGEDSVDEREKEEALTHAKFISECFNKSEDLSFDRIGKNYRYEIRYKYFDSTEETWLGICSICMSLNSMEEALNIALQYKKIVQANQRTTKVAFDIIEN